MTKGLTERKIGGLSLLLAAVWLFGCQGSGKEGAASVHLTLTLPKAEAVSKASAPAPPFIRSVQVEVSGADLVSFSKSVSINPDGIAVVLLEVPAGKARRFVVIAFDGEGIARFRGEATADLPAGAAASLSIAMTPLDVPSPPAPDIEISPRTAFVAKNETKQFSITGIDPALVAWKVTSAVTDDPQEVGNIDGSGLYLAPNHILTDAKIRGSIGSPIPVAVKAVDKNAPAVEHAAAVRLTTGTHLSFLPSRPLAAPGRLISTRSDGQRSVAFHQGHVYAVWSQQIDPRLNAQIIFAESTNGIDWTGQTGAVIDGAGEQSEATLAVGPDGSIYIAFVECVSSCTNTTTVRLAVRRPSDTAFKPVDLPMRGANAQDPSLAVSSEGTVYLAWSASQVDTFFDVLLQRFDRNGKPIDPSPKDLTAANGAFDERQPAIAAGVGDDLFLTWQVSANATEIAATASLDGGESFLPEVRINDTTDLRSSVSRPSVAAGPKGTAYVAWEKDTCGDGCVVIFHNTIKVDPSGVTFQPEKHIGFALNSVRQSSPSVTSDGAGAFYIAFAETLQIRNANGIFLAKSGDEGATFNFSQISDSPISDANNFSPSAVADEAGRVFAIWNHLTTSPQGNAEILFSRGE